MRVIVKIYNEVKYSPKSWKVTEVEYNIEGYKVVCGGAEAEKIESEIDDNSIDEFHEYLVLDLGDGETATFRNSHVDIFRW